MAQPSAQPAAPPDVRHASSGSGSLAAALLGCVSAVALLSCTVNVGPARADTLRQALAAAYRTNPRLDAERARLRASDEEVPRAKAGWRPRIDGSADFGQEKRRSKPASSNDGSGRPWGYQVRLSQPVFRGFRTVNGVAAAEAQVRVSRENLRLVEQQTLLAAATAYMDVLRDRRLVRLQRNNVAVLSRELDAAVARRNAREITRTDVAQARARRARAISDLDSARAALRTSRAVYKQIIGHAPRNLHSPYLKASLIPRTLRRALHIALNESPNVVSAKYREQEARHQVALVRGELLPEVNLEATYGRRFDVTGTVNDQDETRVSGRINVPFYRGGEVHARVRQAKHRHVTRLQQIEQARTETRTQLISAWSRLKAARSRLRSDRMQVSANRTALDGVRLEEKVGQRTLLDLLNAQQELLSAEIALVRTRREVVVAAYTLLGAMGRLNAQELALMSQVYDPAEHYHQVRRKWFGLRITRPDGRHADVEVWDDREHGPGSLK
ncbi:MAG: TolC family outer membrane protein [Pseudomonadota bacterium]